MDPKQQLNQLDPKLRQAYERVMGTSSTSPSTVSSGRIGSPQAGSGTLIPPLNPSINTPSTTIPSMPPPIAANPMSPFAKPVTPPLQNPAMGTTGTRQTNSAGLNGLHTQTTPIAPTIPSMPPHMLPTTPPAAPPMQHTMPIAQPQMAQAHVTPTMSPAAVNPSIPQAVTQTVVVAPTEHVAEKAHVSPNQHGFVAPKKKSQVSPIIWILGGLTFLVVYTIFWVKFFNLPIPFLNQ